MKASSKLFLIFFIFFVLSISYCLIDKSIGQTLPYTEKELKEQIRANPNDAEAHYNLGGLLYDLRGQLDNLTRKDEAEKEYKEAIKINPNYAEAHYNLGVLLSDLKRYAESEKEYKEAIRINPNDAVVQANLGWLYKTTNNKAEAKKELSIARELFEKQNRTEDVKKMDGWLKDLK